MFALLCRFAQGREIFHGELPKQYWKCVKVDQDQWKHVGQMKFTQAANAVTEYCRSADEDIGDSHLDPTIGIPRENLMIYMVVSTFLSTMNATGKLKKGGVNTELRQELLDLAERIWKCAIDERETSVMMTHSIYLKLYQLSQGIPQSFR